MPYFQNVTAADPHSALNVIQSPETVGRFEDPALAIAMTKAASTQTYFTIRYLVDRPLVADAYRAYAYFRWVDDALDQQQLTTAARLAFLKRQQEIIARCYRGERPPGLCPEEQLIATLISHDSGKHGGLRLYIEQMMAVMAFDAERQGCFISQLELARYTHSLATAVTEALHYFIGHDSYSPHDESRYLAVSGAHVTHMLRDALEDTALGYFNIPREYLKTHNFAPADVMHPAFRSWVKARVQLARSYFAAGKAYVARVENRRCRLAGYAYIGRFEVILNAIEKEGYQLRAAYPERKSKKAALRIGLTALEETIRSALLGG